MHIFWPWRPKGQWQNFWHYYGESTLCQLSILFLFSAYILATLLPLVSAQPQITFNYPANTTYTSSSLNVNVSFDDVDSWIYSLNGAANVTYTAALIKKEWYLANTSCVAMWTNTTTTDPEYFWCQESDYDWIHYYHGDTEVYSKRTCQGGGGSCSCDSFGMASNYTDGSYVYIADRFYPSGLANTGGIGRIKTTDGTSALIRDVGDRADTPRALTINVSLGNDITDFWVVDPAHNATLHYNMTGYVDNFTTALGQHTSISHFNSTSFWIYDDNNDHMYEVDGTGATLQDKDYSSYGVTFSGALMLPRGRDTAEENGFVFLDTTTDNVTTLIFYENYMEFTSAEGENNITVCANDTGGTWNCSTLYFGLDTTTPDITISEPANKTEDTRDFSFSFSEEIDTARYSVDGGSNITSATLNTTWSGIFSSVTSGAHNITVWCNDTNGYSNSTIVYFSGDSAKPDVYISRPANTTYNISLVNLDVSSNKTIENWFYEYDSNGTNQSFSPNITLTVTEGYRNITVWANDSYSNLNSSVVYFTVDLTSPYCGNESHPAGTPESAAFLVSIDVADAYSTISTVTADFPFAPNSTLSASGSTYSSYINAPAVTGDRVFNFVIYMNDSAGHTNSTETLSVSITETSGGGTGGGGPSGGSESRSYVCGDGICSRYAGETVRNCPADCTPSVENFTFSVSDEIISWPTTVDFTFVNTVMVQNPNAFDMLVNVYPLCIDDDISCEWLTFNTSEGETGNDVMVVVPAGSEAIPGTEEIIISMTVPADAEMRSYNANIAYAVESQDFILSTAYELRSFLDMTLYTMFLADLWDLKLLPFPQSLPFIGDGIYGWHVAVLALMIIVAAMLLYFVPKRKKRKIQFVDVLIFIAVLLLILICMFFFPLVFGGA